MTEDKKNEYVMMLATVAVMIAIIVRYFAPLKAKTRYIGVQANRDQENAVSLHK